MCAPCGATNWRCALCCRGTGRHKARLVLSDPASAHDAERWWGKHRVEPAHKRRAAARRERMGRGDIGGGPYGALRAAVLAQPAQVQEAAARRMGLPHLLLNTAADAVYRHRHEETVRFFVAEMAERGRESREPRAR